MEGVAIAVDATWRVMTLQRPPDVRASGCPVLPEAAAAMRGLDPCRPLWGGLWLRDRILTGVLQIMSLGRDRTALLRDRV
jgi:hypothetical protein